MELVLDEFYKTCLTQKVVTDGGMEYARAVLEKAFGEISCHSEAAEALRSYRVQAEALPSLPLLLQAPRSPEYNTNGDTDGANSYSESAVRDYLVNELKEEGQSLVRRLVREPS